MAVRARGGIVLRYCIKVDRGQTVGSGINGPAEPLHASQRSTSDRRGRQSGLAIRQRQTRVVVDA